MNIKTYNAISPKGLAALKDAGYQINADEDADGILLRSQKLQNSDVADSVKAVVRAGAGFNNIPVADLSARGIPVFNTPGGNANAVKELTIAALIMAARPILAAVRFAQETRGGDVSLRTESNKGGYRGTELSGKTLGVIGLGNVGSKVANTALDLDMEVIGYDPGLNANTAWRIDRRVEHASNLDDLLNKSDYITVHIPLNEANRHFIDADKLAKMKPSAALINFSRGGIVDDQAVVKALDADKLRLFTTDFSDDVLFDQPKVMVTPHIGGSTIEAEDTSAMMAAHQMEAFLEDGNIINSVNFPEMNLPFTSQYRIGVLHKNVPNMLGQISKVFGQVDINIAELNNRSRGDYAYTLVAFDHLGQGQTEAIQAELKAIPQVLNLHFYEKKA
ncbi:3-phosphoglycerate dehydrogenase family protein [Eupransor demetentiae]|uniref:D-3-phosphoglycerate dehydrogenase n=1 Tax=Eupransor demetentiae TaxID=3109584 RepID=A0ABM9N4U4_9LACO|nr:Phosphoglycerate dehydrogenase or related dehydrogenase (SerA) [Lactobacillaceae bacterium LMG 33000]